MVSGLISHCCTDKRLKNVPYRDNAVLPGVKFKSCDLEKCSHQRSELISHMKYSNKLV